MNIKLFSILITSTLLNYTLKAEETATPLTSKLITVTANATLEKDEQELHGIFSHGSKPSIKFTFMVKAKNIVQVMEKSVAVKDSKDWKCGSFPRISKKGNAATFVIEKDGDFMETLNNVTVEGTIDIQTGSKVIEKTFNLMSYEEPFQLDDFVFTLQEDKLKVTGNHKLIKELVVEHNGQILRQAGSNWSDNYRSYNYKGIGKGVKITISYWDDIVTKNVKFLKK